MGTRRKPLNEVQPGNPRYQPRVTKPILGYDHLYRPYVEVELAMLRALANRGVIPADVIATLTPQLEARLLTITTTEVDKVERAETNHDIRALVLVMKRRMGNRRLARYLHLGLTSYDVIDTGRALMSKRAYAALRTQLVETMRLLQTLIAQHADIVQIGRTHLQHALPITIGFWLATILARLLHNLQQMDRTVAALTGKISGAVGAHHSETALLYGMDELNEQGQTLEDEVLASLGLTPGLISTQILLPEPLAEFLFAVTMTTQTIGQFGNDLRRLMSTEIGEIAKVKAEGETGSSSMPFKTNPIEAENEAGTAKRTRHAMGLVLETMISDHQRDLVDSSAMRDFPVILVNLALQLQMLVDRGQLKKLAVHQGNCHRNLHMTSHVIGAEPAYVALQLAGYPDAHALMNNTIVPRVIAASTNSNSSIVAQLELYCEETGDTALATAMRQVPEEIWRLVDHPELYVGQAPALALKVNHAVSAYLDTTSAS